MDVTRVSSSVYVNWGRQDTAGGFGNKRESI